MNDLMNYFKELQIVGNHEGYRYSVSETAVIIVLGLLCGLENVSQIHQWASEERTRLFMKEHFGILDVPCYYWMLCLVKMIVPEPLNKCFIQWVESTLPNGKKGMTIALDGKTIRSTAKSSSKKSSLHIVSAQLSEMGITLGQRAVDEKSNEIPAVQDLLKELDVSGCMIVADALNCQKKTAETIVENHADYLLDAKDNQASLKAEIKEYVQDDVLRAEMDYEDRKKQGPRRETYGVLHGRYQLAQRQGSVGIYQVYWSNTSTGRTKRPDIRRVALLYFQQGIEQQGTAGDSQKRMGRGNDALAIGCTFRRRLLPDL